MQTTFEKLGGTYRPMGDYLLPDIEAPESPQIGIWGQPLLSVMLRIRTQSLYRWIAIWCIPNAQTIWVNLK